MLDLLNFDIFFLLKQGNFHRIQSKFFA